MSKTPQQQSAERLKYFKFDDVAAEILSREIYNAVKNLHSNEYLDIKFKQLDAKLKFKLEKLNSILLKWYIGISLTQIIGIFIPILIAFSSYIGSK